MNAVKWPGKAYDENGEDLSAPVQQLLRDLNLLEGQRFDQDGKAVPDEVGALKGTPPSLQGITSGATALSKAWASLVAVFGGGTALWTALQGFGADPQDEPLQRAVFVASAGVLLATVVVAIALIVKADVTSRAQAAAAEYGARSNVTAALLNSFQYGRPLPPPPTPEPRYWLRRKDAQGRIEDKWHPVHGFEYDETARGLMSVLDDGTEVAWNNIAEWATSTTMNGVARR